MDKRLASLCRDVINGKLLEENIPLLFNYMTDRYESYTGVRLVMHYVTLYEARLDNEGLWSQASKDITHQINTLIREDLLNKSVDHEPQKTIVLVDDMRNSIMDRMKVLTAFTDVLINFEYILNRVEYRFIEDCEYVEDDDNLAREILRYIFDSQDNVIINEKIKDMIGQLPVRLSKQKYFDILRASHNNYKGAKKASFNMYLYLLKSAAMLEPIDEIETMYPNLWEAKSYLWELDYQNLSKSEYEKASKVLTEAISFLNEESSNFYSLQEVMNGVYALLLCKSYAGISGLQDENHEVINSLLRDINEGFVNIESSNPAKDGNTSFMDEFELSDEVLSKLTKLEGLQEEHSIEFMELEDALYIVDTRYRELTKSMMLDKVLNVLLRIKDLLSSSIFIDWREKLEDDLLDLDEKELDARAAKLEAKLTELFASHDKMIMRAIMANTLNKLPVFFKDHKEVMDYVLYSLKRCSDPYEKAACTEIILGIIEE